MSAEAMGEVLKSDVGAPDADGKGGAPTKRLVLLCLANNANAHGYCWPGGAHLAGSAQVSERSVWRAIAALEDEGILTRVRRERSNGSWSSNAYRINFGALVARRRVVQKRETDELAALFAAADESAGQPGYDTVSHHSDQGKQENPSSARYDTVAYPDRVTTPRHGGYDTVSDHGGDTVSPLEPSLEPSVDPSEKNPPTPASGGDLADPDEQPPRPDRCAAHGRPTCRPCGTSPRQVARAQQADEQTVAASERVRVQVQSREEHARRRQAAMGAGSGARQAIREHFARRDAG